MAEDLRQKEIEEEKRRVQEREAEWLKLNAQRQLEEPQPQHAMPGVFPDSPMNMYSGETEDTTVTQPDLPPRNLFSNLTKRLGLEHNAGKSQNPFQSLFQNRTTQEKNSIQSDDVPGTAPPPYSETDPEGSKRGPNVDPNKPKAVTSPSQLHSNLLSAISACRPHGASGVYSRPGKRPFHPVHPVTNQ